MPAAEAGADADADLEVVDDAVAGVDEQLGVDVALVDGAGHGHRRR